LVDNAPLNSLIPTVDDVPEGTTIHQARVMVWEPVGKAWIVYDPAPTAHGNGVFSTTIDSIASYVDNGSRREVYFALEALASNAADQWLRYE
jgi:hypothetical protein